MSRVFCSEYRWSGYRVTGLWVCGWALVFEVEVIDIIYKARMGNRLDMGWWNVRETFLFVCVYEEIMWEEEKKRQTRFFQIILNGQHMRNRQWEKKMKWKSGGGEITFSSMRQNICMIW